MTKQNTQGQTFRLTLLEYSAIIEALDLFTATYFDSVQSNREKIEPSYVYDGNMDWMIPFSLGDVERLRHKIVNNFGYHAEVAFEKWAAKQSKRLENDFAKGGEFIGT